MDTHYTHTRTDMDTAAKSEGKESQQILSVTKVQAPQSRVGVWACVYKCVVVCVLIPKLTHIHTSEAKFATSTPGGGSASSSSSTADNPKRTLGYTGGGSSRKRAKPRAGRKACENASSTLFVIPAYHDIPIWNHVQYRSEVFDSSPPRKRWVHD